MPYNGRNHLARQIMKFKWQNEMKEINIMILIRTRCAPYYVLFSAFQCNA